MIFHLPGVDCQPNPPCCQSEFQQEVAVMNQQVAAQAFGELVAVIKALRTPGTGCPWDLEQNHHTLRPYLIEEAHEVLDAIDRRDDGAFAEELGDLLLQIVLHAQVAQDRGAFTIAEVVRGITAKMVRRHPHVFGSAQVSGSAEVVRNWEQIKAAETQGKGADPSCAAALRRLPEALPALLRAQRQGEKVSKVGFDWTSLRGVVDKVREEFAELEKELQLMADACPPAAAAAEPGPGEVPDPVRGRLEHELGDVLFSVCQLARWLGVSAEDSLRDCTRRFTERFRRMEQQAPQPLRELTATQIQRQWQQTKQA
jgi:MazG family protein